MLFSPWLSTFRHKARRQTASSRRLRSRRDERHLFPRATEILETRTLLTGPTFVSVSPNVGDFLQDGDIRTEVPQELEFQFSLADSIDPATLGAIQVIGAGHDGVFAPASTVTDFGTGGGVVVRIGAGSVGAEENGSTLTILNADNLGNGPTLGVATARNEIQQLSLPSDITGGTFQLTFFGNTTASIAFDADAATVQTELEALANIDPGDVIVTGGPLPGSTMSVEFRGQYARTNVPQMFLNSASLTNNEFQTVDLPGSPTAGNLTLRLNDPGNSIVGNSLAIDFDSLARNERQFISTTGTPTGGNFTLDFNDAGSGIMGTSNNIAFDADAAAVQAAIEGGIAALAGNILVTAGPLPGEVAIQFIGTLAATNVAPFVLNNNGLTGGTAPSVTIRQSNSVLTALEGIAGLAGNLQVTGTALPNTVTVEFINGLADTNLAQFTVNSNTLSGGTSTAVTLQTTVQGNQSGSVSTTQTASTGGLTLTLDSNATLPTTTDLLLDFIANDPVASQVLSAEVLSGDTGLDISGATLFRTLSGAGAASVISDLQTGTDLRVQITADAAGLDGNRIFVQLNRQDRGAGSSAPQVIVSGNRIEVVLNDDPTMTAQTTAQDLVDALNAAAGTLITASVAIGDGATVVSDVQDGTVLQLSGADTVINAGYRDVTGSSSGVIYRFAETLPDDLYRIEVRGRGATPLRDTDGEAFADGLADHFQTFTLNLGSQVRSVVPQPVLRQQLLRVTDLTA